MANCIWENDVCRTNCYWLRQMTLQVESGQRVISDFVYIVFATLCLFYSSVIHFKILYNALTCNH